jgi:hypothetical protein
MRVQKSKEFLHVPAGSTNTSLSCTGLSTVRTLFYITSALPSEEACFLRATQQNFHANATCVGHYNLTTLEECYKELVCNFL